MKKNNEKLKKRGFFHSVRTKEGIQYLLAIIALVMVGFTLYFGESKLILSSKSEVTVPFNKLYYQITPQVVGGETPQIEYAYTLTQALEKAVSGSTITVLSDVTESSAIVIPANKTITIDLNEKTIALENGMTNNGTLTLTGEGEIYAEDSDTIVNNGTYTQQESAKVSNGGDAEDEFCALVNNGTMTITGGEVESNYYGIKQTEVATLVVTRTEANNVTTVVGPHITSKEEAGIYAEKGTVTIGTNETPTTNVNGENPTVRGKTHGMEAAVAATVNYYDGLIISESGKGTAIDYPGTLNTPSGKQLEYSITIEEIDNVDVEVETMKIIVPVYNEYDATTGNVVGYYETLNKALNSSENGYTVKPVGNVASEGAVTLESGKDVILDLDGKTITLTGTITNEGTLAIIGDGTITGSINKIISNEGTLSLGIEDNSNGVSDTDPEIIGTTIGIENKSGATLNIYEGTIKVPAGENNHPYTGTLGATSEGYSVREKTETQSGVSYKIAYISNEYVATLDANGGTIPATTGWTVASGSASATKSVVYGNEYGTMPTATRTGYRFDGWKGKNLFTGLIKGVSISSATGNEESNQVSATSDYIPVNFTNNVYYLSGLSSNLRSFVAFYNENKEFMGRTNAVRINYCYLRGVSSIVNRATGVEGNISYIRITQYELDGYTEGTIDQIDNLQIQLEVGNTATAYEPYYIISTTNVAQANDHTLTAKWTPNTYSVRFNANGGTGTMSDQSMTYGSSANLTANSFTKANFAFAGWNTSADGSGTSYTDEQSVSNLSSTNGATVDLYAQWKLDVNVGDTIQYSPSGTYSWDPALAESTDPAGSPTTLSSANGETYRITTWRVLSVDENGNIEIVPTAPVGSLTLEGAQGYNNAVKLLNDTCNALYSNPSKGITARSINIEDIENVINNYGDSSVLTSAKTSAGYNTQKDSAYLTENSIYPEIYASEDKNVIDGVEGTGIGLSEQIEDAQNNTLFIERNAGNNYNGTITTATSITPYQTYYYLDNNEFVTALGGNDSVYREVLLNNSTPNYWVASRCVGLNSNYCNFSVRYVNSGNLSASYVCGSHDCPDGSSRALFPVVSLNASVLESTETLDVFRVPANTYTIKYNANEGTGTMADQSMTYDVSANLSTNTFTRENYRFTGWNTLANGTGTSYTDGESVSNLTYTNGATVNLYAQWEQLQEVTNAQVKDINIYDIDTRQINITNAEYIENIQSYSSNNTSVATVSNTGLVTAVAVGTTTVTITGNSGATKTVNVTIKPSYNSSKSVNSPKLTDGMIPIKWNGSTWVVCSEDDSSWYNYGTTSETKLWANVMLSDGTYKADTVEVDQTVAESDLGSMYVWIPRFSYQMPTNATTTKGTIDVTFLESNTDEDENGTSYGKATSNVNTETTKVVHPAFTFGNKELTGFWMAKFEMSGKNSSNQYVGNASASSSTPVEVGTAIAQSLPNVPSWRHITIGESEYQSMLIAGDNKASYGLDYASSHLIKNSEWGAVAYLCYSNYGNVPKINGCGTYDGSRYYDMYTGQGPVSSSSESRYDYDSSTTIADHGYSTANGILASTTGNITGIYDMNGGSWERVAAYLNNGNGYLTEYGQSSSNSSVKYFIGGVLQSAYQDLWDAYEVSNEERTNKIAVTEDGVDKEVSQGYLWNASRTALTYIEARYRLTKYIFDHLPKGIGVNEISNDFSFYNAYNNGTSNTWGWYIKYDNNVTDDYKATTYKSKWNSDYVLIGHASKPFVVRGGYCSNGSGAGVLASNISNGYSSDNIGFRAVLVP